LFVRFGLTHHHLHNLFQSQCPYASCRRSLHIIACGCHLLYYLILCRLSAPRLCVRNCHHTPRCSQAVKENEVSGTNMPTCLPGRSWRNLRRQIGMQGERYSIQILTQKRARSPEIKRCLAGGNSFVNFKRRIGRLLQIHPRRMHGYHQSRCNELPQPSTFLYLEQPGVITLRSTNSVRVGDSVCSR
jgi:hypothetical protein